MNVDFSCEHIIRFTAKLHNYSDKDIVTTENFIIARVPDKMGDVTGANKFFEVSDMITQKPPTAESFEDMERKVKNTYVNKIDVGHSLISVAVKLLLEPKNYCFY